MAMSNAQRQAKYRAKHQATHKTIEVALKRDVYDILQDLAQSSDKSRQDIITELICATQDPIKALQVTDANSKEEKNKQPADNALPVTKTALQSDSETVKLWLGVSQCQSSTKNKKLCRIKTNLTMVSFNFRKQTYQAMSCQLHKDCFSIHKNYF